ncbi:MAG: carboxypeptidase regulatory-like domain-containing protein [Gammaproteobacteria bacterium]|nr:carboxypeptidase regulatory-like domain-containing protein [Gammaproteobacteria bacterium]
MRRFSILNRLFLLFAGLVVAINVSGAEISGKVTSVSGEALTGVMVRFTEPESGVSESVFTRKDGSYSISTRLSGLLQVRLRLPYYRDRTTNLTNVGAKSEHELSFAMEEMVGNQEISDSLPAAFHFGNLPYEEGDDALFNRYQFQRDCLTCHQLGDPLTRVVRTAEGWVGTIQRMHAYLGNFDAELRDRRSVILAKGFDGYPLKVRPQFPIDPSLFTTKITEYRMERGIVPHDAIVHPTSGLIFTIDQGADHMAITDPDTGATNYISQSRGGTEYHEFGSVAGEIAVFNGRNGPHSLALHQNGKYYVTNTSTNSIGVFNPEAMEWEPLHFIGHGADYPHTIRVDSKGTVWFTLAGSEQVGKLDPTTGKTQVVNLPKVEPGGMSGGTTPYGIDIDPIHGDIWYTRLFGDRIGRIDPVTLKVTEYESPVRGPRRMRFDRSGILWVTGYSEGMLARIETDGFETTVYQMPEFVPNHRPAPYALGVHPQTQDIWINENMTDRIYRFIPDEERFIAYPIPLSGTYTRDTDFMADGSACMSNNPVPASALEGGVLQLICINVNGNAEKDTQEEG